MATNNSNKIQILPLRRATRATSSARSSGSGSNGISPHSNANESGNDEDRRKQSKKPRASKPKVRTGCTTCKIRKVKCDETKPSCDRCTTTGRKCDGYSTAPRKNARRSPNQADLDNDGFQSALERSLETSRTSTPQELLALEFFYTRTAPSLASYFDASFWTQLVQQISRVEPAIMHAMVAVGHLNLQRQTSRGPWTQPWRRVAVLTDPLAVSVPIKRARSDHDDPFAIGQYNKAIRLLAQRLREPEQAVEVALLACILFVCIEFLRGDVEPAFKHFKAGIGIAMASLEGEGGSAKNAGAVLANQRIREEILPFFHRIELLGMLFGQEMVSAYPVLLEQAVPGVFGSVRMARDSIVHLLNLSLRFIRTLRSRKYAGCIAVEDLSRRAALQSGIERWTAALDTLLLTDNVSSRDVEGAKVLRIHQVIMQIWLGTACEAEESATDKFMPQFEAAVILGESIQQSLGTFGDQPTFLFDMEIVSPLYFVGIKCRHPLLRRRAINILRSTTRREGLWDSDMAAVVAGRVIALEEVNLTVRDGSEFPVERDRIHNTQILSVTGTTPSQHSLSIYSKPSGLDADWLVREEVVDFDVDNVTERRLLKKFPPHRAE
ncbi:hypothetical protein LTR62_002053 [Meristemomyces frigidus]|uniref:Zn(2)-C6 fungal-type domain-containing protein n=1 Tax=Meristemomyces frigidus TaxID=1508187 RepID=A0AAN7TLC8_9PEZI|nr:hypothetical protein LTR62_002053 [Meristemomyces frigidus]